MTSIGKFSLTARAVPAAFCALGLLGVSSCKKETFGTGKPVTSAPAASPTPPSSPTAIASSGTDPDLPSGDLQLAPVEPAASGTPYAGEAATLMQSGQWPAERLAFYKKWATQNPQAAIDHAAKNNPGASTSCVSAVLEGWAAVDRTAALAWVEERQPNAERSLWTGQLARIWPEDQLDALAGPVAATAGKPAGRTAVEAYAVRLIAGDPSRAFLWMHSSIEEPRISSEMAETVMGSWAARETEKASEWLATVPATEPWRDRAVAGLIRGVASLDSETARQWARSINEPGLREVMLTWIESGSTPSVEKP